MGRMAARATECIGQPNASGTGNGVWSAALLHVPRRALETIIRPISSNVEGEENEEPATTTTTA